MTLDAVLTLIILVATLVILASQRLRSDLTALCVTLALILTGVLSPAEAFSAFAQPVIIIIPCVFILGAALYETGVATLIANQLMRVGTRNPVVLILVIMLTAGLLSAVVTSMLIIAVLMPAVLRIARRARLAPSLLLLPLVSGATMGNLLTLIGAISHLVVSDLLVVSGYEPLGFFSLTPIGLASLTLAVGWYLLVGRRLLRREMPAEPQLPSLDEVERDYQLDRQLHRLRIRSVSDLIARRLDRCELGPTFRLNVMAVKPKAGNLEPAKPDHVLEQDDILIVEGSIGDVLQAASLHGLEPKGPVPLDEFNLIEEDTLRLAELIVPLRSELVGKTLAQCRFRERYGLNILAVHRQGQAILDDLPDLNLAVGDTLLVQGPISYLRQIGRDMNLISATQLGPQPGDRITRKAKLALGILGLMVICVVTGILPLATASLAAALALILTGCLSAERAYESINGRVIVLIGGMLPLAMALEKTGVAELIAGWLSNLSQDIGTLSGLLLLCLFTSILSQIASNSVAAALMTPIALSLAAAEGLAYLPFAIAIAVAATTSYITPLTNADNLMVREAGGYTMRDYLVNGLPIFLMQMTVLMLYLTVLL
jgi:di/tricarboxylate transporter